MYSECYSSFLSHCVCVWYQGSVSREEYDDLQTRFATAEKALADKQLKIDEMKMEIFQKEKELETISVFQAQVQTIVRWHGWLAVMSLILKKNCILPLFIFESNYYVFFVCTHTGRDIFLWLLRWKSSSGEDSRGERAFGHSTGVCEETEQPTSGGDGITWQVRRELQTLTLLHVTSVQSETRFFFHASGIPWVRCKGDMCHVGPIHKAPHLHIICKEVEVVPYLIVHICATVPLKLDSERTIYIDLFLPQAIGSSRIFQNMLVPNVGKSYLTWTLCRSTSWIASSEPVA